MKAPLARLVSAAVWSHAIMPDFRAPSGFGMVTSTSKTRLEGSAEWATRVIWPRKVFPGTASTFTF
jgi:hypothetical protein